MARKFTALLLSLLLVFCLVACGSSDTSEETDSDVDTTTEEIEEKPAEDESDAEEETEEDSFDEEDETFGIGDTWTVDDQWSLTVTGIEETDYRNEYSDKDPGAVYYISFTYTNLGYVDEDGLWDGVYMDLEDASIVDAEGMMGTSYPGNISSYPQETPVGATCSAQSCIGVDNPGVVTLYYSKYDGNGVNQSATFVLDPADDTVVIVADTASVDVEIEDAYEIGDTWTVEDQWSLTVTGIEETDYRNEYSDKDPGAVYYISYTYTNLGYVDEDGLWDGVYIDLEDSNIVDSGGMMGTSYPGNISNYPQETPVGATCNAQCCIGVDNAGAVTLHFSKYDGNEINQSAIFVLDPSA